MIVKEKGRKMNDITIRELQGDEMLEAMYGLNAYCFHLSPPLTNKDEWKDIVSHREGVTYFALLENGKAISGVAGTVMLQNVRGKIFEANGVWGVASAPSARRQGYCRKVMKELLSALREKGQAFSCLYPFRESFYERMGYVTFPLPVIAKLSPPVLLPLLEKDLGGQVELALIGDGFDTYLDYLHTMQKDTHGMALFKTPDLYAAQRNRLWLALAKVNGQAAGLMLYQVKGEEVARFLFSAPRFYYTSSQGKYLLLQWIARHTDQASQVEIWLHPTERPETWLADTQVKIESQVRAPMVRILDISRLSGMSVGPGSFSARITDPLCPWNEGIWRFAEQGGQLQVNPSQFMDCTLTIQALTALVFGTHDPGDFATRGWGDPSPELQNTLRRLFPSRLPFMHEYF
jgi:predicted acetyltransferase